MAQRRRAAASASPPPVVASDLPPSPPRRRCISEASGGASARTLPPELPPPLPLLLHSPPYHALRMCKCEATASASASASAAEPRPPPSACSGEVAVASSDSEEERAFDLFDDAAEATDEEWQPVVLGRSAAQRQVTFYFLPRRIWIWDASRILSDWCLENAAALRGRHVLEVGSGLGLPAIAASAYAASVLCTDFSKEAMDGLDEAIDFNVRANAESEHKFENLRSGLLDWRDVLAAESTAEGYQGEYAAADVILGADVIYTLEHPLPLASTIDTLLKPGGILVLTAKNIRAGLPEFLVDIQRRGFELTRKEPHLGATDHCEYSLFLMTKPLSAKL